MADTIIKGDWVRAEWMAARMTCLAGVQTKFGASPRSVSGIVRHIRGNHPTNPTSIRLWVEPEGGGEEVLVNPAWVKDHRPKNGPLNQCEHPNMVSDDNVHWHCPDCPMSFDDGVEEPQDQEHLAKELETMWPPGVLKPSQEYPGVEKFTVRLWDMLDGWIDVESDVSEQEAMDYWMGATKNGTKNTKYSDGDYYRICPANTSMVVTPEFLGR